MKERVFVAIGRKGVKGKIKKGVDYMDIGEFTYDILPEAMVVVEKKDPTVFDRMFNTQRYKDYQACKKEAIEFNLANKILARIEKHSRGL